jgi:hypothetical protein
MIILKAVNPPDDEIRWYGALTNLWFESSVNMSLRYGANVGSIPDCIPALLKLEMVTMVLLNLQMS